MVHARVAPEFSTQLLQLSIPTLPCHLHFIIVTYPNHILYQIHSIALCYWAQNFLILETALDLDSAQLGKPGTINEAS